MQKKIRILGGVFAAFIVIAVGSFVIVAQNAVTGTWEASIKEKSPDKIQLSLERRTDSGGRNQNGSSYSFSELQGLNREQATNGKVTFRLVRDAGSELLPISQVGGYLLGARAIVFAGATGAALRATIRDPAVRWAARPEADR